MPPNCGFLVPLPAKNIGTKKFLRNASQYLYQYLFYLLTGARVKKKRY